MGLSRLIRQGQCMPQDKGTPPPTCHGRCSSTHSNVYTFLDFNTVKLGFAGKLQVGESNVRPQRPRNSFFRPFAISVQGNEPFRSSADGNTIAVGDVNLSIWRATRIDSLLALLQHPLVSTVLTEKKILSLKSFDVYAPSSSWTVVHFTYWHLKNECIVIALL